MKVRAVDGLELSVSVLGSGPPLLLVHGSGGASGMWGEPALAHLSGYRILAVDLPGHGASDDPAGAERVRLDSVLDDLTRVLDVAGVRSCPWVGYSMGGRIALAAAVLHSSRVTRLVLESASPGIADERERADRRVRDHELATRIEREGVEAWAQEWERQPLFAGRTSAAGPAAAGFVALRRANRATSLAAWLRGMGSGVQPEFWGRLARIDVPTLLLTGEHDRKYTAIASRMSRMLPTSEQVVVPGAGHTVHLETPADWGRVVAGFLSGPVGTRP